MSTAEEIEVNVRQIDESTPTSTPNPSVQMFELMRKLMLAGVGAFALSRDEAETFLNRLVERGELAQKDSQRIMDEMMARLRTATQPQAAKVEHTLTGVSAQVSGISTQVESSLEQFLNRLNIPSKRDIDELSAKIAQLAARVEELRRNQDGPGKARVTKAHETKADESA
jgi:poly(hydroxyalkanoate) granule-associated protein